MWIDAWETWICPHCKIQNRFEYSKFYHDWTSIQQIDLKNSANFDSLYFCRCTNCWKNIIFLEDNLIYPIASSRPPCPNDVPESISKDYLEACLVEPYSQKAAWAIARRCLQNMLHERWISWKDLNAEIDIAMNNLPSHLSEAIDAIRHIWNFSAHPIKYKNSWEIVDIEEGEVEWVLDTLEQLFDFYYVAPRITKEKRDALNLKLAEVGKPELK